MSVVFATKGRIMTKYIDKIYRSGLFDGIKKEDIPVLLKCLGAVERKYKKGGHIITYGDNVSCIFMVAEGCVHIVKTDHWGNESILAEAGAGSVFGEAYAALKNVRAKVNVAAVRDTVVMEMNIDRMLTTCSSACEFHTRLIRNFIAVIAKRNMELSDKLECMSQRSTRDKIMNYLSLEAEKNESDKIDIPFNRQQMADFLAVDRSAMSKELGKMQNEGIIKFNKNHFELLK